MNPTEVDDDKVQGAWIKTADGGDVGIYRERGILQICHYPKWKTFPDIAVSITREGVKVQRGTGPDNVSYEVKDPQAFADKLVELMRSLQ